jgi:hypothetical protein
VVGRTRLELRSSPGSSRRSAALLLQLATIGVAASPIAKRPVLALATAALVGYCAAAYFSRACFPSTIRHSDTTDGGCAVTFMEPTPGCSTGESSAKARTQDSARSARRQDSAVDRAAWLIHKWAGLFAAAWLAVLGATGFLLDNPEWTWLQQIAAPSFLTTPRLAQIAATSVAPLRQIDPERSAVQIAAGPRGMWATTDGGAHWEPTRFGEGESVQVFAVEPDPEIGWKRLWIGTSDGLYASADRGATAQPTALAGSSITALAAGATPTELLGVVDRSSLFRLSASDPSRIEPIDIAPLQKGARPTETSLYRYVRSIHSGRGLFDAPSSRLVNELGALALIVLAITGLLFWGLPKSWSARAEAGERAAWNEAKHKTFAWLYRLHAATVGLLASPIILYLAVTGILADHNRHELAHWLRATRVPAGYLTPAMKLSSWSGQIDSVVGYPGVPDAFSVGNHFGMFTTIDDGREWAREEDGEGRAIGDASRMRRLGDAVVVFTAGKSGGTLIRSDDGVVSEPTLGMRPSGMHEGRKHERRIGDEPQRRAQPAKMDRRSTPQDATRADGNLYWSIGDKFVVTDASGQMLETRDAPPPKAQGAPLFMWFRQLHTGMLIWTEWRWINDVFAIAAILLAITGLIRWQRRKWM